MQHSSIIKGMPLAADLGAWHCESAPATAKPSASTPLATGASLMRKYGLDYVRGCEVIEMRDEGESTGRTGNRPVHCLSGGSACLVPSTACSTSGVAWPVVCRGGTSQHVPKAGV